MHESRHLKFSRSLSGATVVLDLEDCDTPLPTGLGTGGEAFVFDWTHPKGNPTVFVVGLEARFEHIGFCVYELAVGGWLRHESGGMQDETFREFVEDDEFDIELFESHMAGALA